MSDETGSMVVGDERDILSIIFFVKQVYQRRNDSAM